MDPWVPACAGMTYKRAEITKGGEGIRRREITASIEETGMALLK